jgi:hypothetical protein
MDARLTTPQGGRIACVASAAAREGADVRTCLQQQGKAGRRSKAKTKRVNVTAPHGYPASCASAASHQIERGSSAWEYALGLNFQANNGLVTSINTLQCKQSSIIDTKTRGTRLCASQPCGDSDRRYWRARTCQHVNRAVDGMQRAAFC